MQTNFLVLKDGTVFRGEAFGYPAPKAKELSFTSIVQRGTGEVVFNTGMTGYHEILTDPSYSGQMVLMTYPHIGNYGCLNDWSETGPEEIDRRPRVKPGGFIVRSLYRGPIPSGRITLDEFLKQSQTPGISGIDTRSLTLKLRDQGNQNGVIVAPVDPSATELTSDELTLIMKHFDEFPQMEGLNMIEEVGSQDVSVENPGGTHHVALVDCGLKANIVREFVKRDCKVTIIPHQLGAKAVLDAKPDGVIFSNGPGDPAVLTDTIKMIKDLIGKMPVWGICLGHQMIAEALGATTFKMKFGHHGTNQPVRDERTGKVFVTSQNHGFAVKEDTIPDNVAVWFRNANDKTVEGLYHKDLPVLSAQFHPESAPGPHDSTWIFQAFLDTIKG
ncbi:glutamine-hydrolyzing carbamoyl-phosphate synthase small subunit [Spirochaeta cellobiosiphila]|uniref:glutamine-hydrolyzing carbamoyl-phosphate synthase small subunit n=1 Tax=Spirochaeta cellobiosiphila TaxID=504483 RepID=UPI0004001AF3|nr:glutamine-hydrolyzing carbamoyl-phosphate synthase small subunit [Spirochaeta cellobiosiphila]